MKRAAALLAAVGLALTVGGCGDGGAEPGAPSGASDADLVLDFTPNAVHAGIYAALREGYYSARGIDLNIREPSASTDAPKLLEAGRADFAILDIHDLAIAREHGLDLVGVAPIVERPLAAVIAGDRNTVKTPADLAGKTVGVTGLPSDDAVLDSVLQSAGLGPDSVKRVTIGFGAIPALAAGRVDAATAFWNAEGITLKRKGVPIRVFRVDDFGAPRYPELILTTSRATLRNDPGLVRGVVDATRRGYALAAYHPGKALDDLLARTSGLDRGEEAAQLDALDGASAFVPAASFLIGGSPWLEEWPKWEAEHGIVNRPPALGRMFSFGFEPDSSATLLKR
jgi:putative hydroxymethylpyrimidine transport system substrate-binding protein